MFKKFALLLSVLAVSNFAFANTGSERSAAGKTHEERHPKAYKEHDKGHDKAHEHHGDNHEKKRIRF